MELSAPDYREKQRLRKAAWRAANPDRKEKARAKNGKVQRNRPFVGVDGEGYDLNGRHVYNMLRAGDRLLVPENGAKFLDTWQILDFLTGLDPKKIYVAYFFDYDVTKILEGIGYYKLKRLMNRDSRMPRSGPANHPYPIDLADGLYQVDYMPGKHFKCRKFSHEEPTEDGHIKRVYSPWITINDVGSFFQCRFTVALERWNIGTPGMRAAIEEGKQQRNSHSLEDFERIEQYNRLEIIMLQQLMEEFRNACAEVGYVPRNWQGPGQIAEVMLAVNGIERTSNVPLLCDPRYTDLIEFGRNAFYGGRPETTAIGPVPGPIYQWDINSAYPYALLHVPCLEHGEWEYREAGRGEKLPIPDMSLNFGWFGPKIKGKHNRAHIYGLPFRTKDGVIMYPEMGKGWYWGFEINASIHQEFRVISQWSYRQECQCQPFRFIRDVYAQRKALGKDGKGIVLKLALNSLYGKMAQSIGYPKYANPIWASFITAYCRTQIQTLLHSTCSDEKACGKNVYMIATDALFTSEELPIEESEELGGYSKEVHPDGIFIVQPGLYFGTSGKGAKTRGVPLGLITNRESEFRENYKRMLDSYRIGDGDVTIPMRNFIGIRQAVHRRNMRIIGQWIESNRTISFDWTRKRNNQHIIPNQPFSDHISTLPYLTPPQECTTPYSKDIGGILELQHLEQMDQPDWSDEAYMQAETE